MLEIKANAKIIHDAHYIDVEFVLSEIDGVLMWVVPKRDFFMGQVKELKKPDIDLGQVKLEKLLTFNSSAYCIPFKEEHLKELTHEEIALR